MCGYGIKIVVEVRVGLSPQEEGKKKKRVALVL